MPFMLPCVVKSTTCFGSTRDLSGHRLTLRGCCVCLPSVILAASHFAHWEASAKKVVFSWQWQLYVFGLLLLNYVRGEPNVSAGLGTAEVLRTRCCWSLENTQVRFWTPLVLKKPPQPSKEHLLICLYTADFLVQTLRTGVIANRGTKDKECDMRVRKILTGIMCFTALVCLASRLFAQELPISNPESMRQCANWPSYRDTQLYREWDVAFNQYEIHSEQVEYVTKLLREVRDDSLWTRSDAALKLGQVASTLRTASDFVFDIISMLPGASTTVAVARDAVQEGVDAYKEGQPIGQVVSRMAVETVKSAAASAGLSNLSNSALAAKTLTENIQNTANLEEQQASLKSEVFRVSSMLENQLSQFRMKMSYNQEKMRAINRFKNEIDRACQEAAQSTRVVGFAGRWAGFVNKHPSEFLINISNGQVSGSYKQGNDAPLPIQAAVLSDKNLQFENNYSNWACFGMCTIKWTLNLISENTIQGNWRNGPMSGSFTMQRK